MQKILDEQSLIEGLKNRDPIAFKLLLEKYKNNIANICYRFLLNSEDAEELAQEVFIDIYKGIQYFRGDSKLSTWIYKLATSKSIDLIRSRKRNKRFGYVFSIFGLEEKGREIPDSNYNNPVKNMENEEKGEIIRNAINTLPIKYRRIFTLSKCEGFSNRQVAEIMELSQSSVESILHRANKKLREILYSSFKKEIKKKSKKMQMNSGNTVSNKGKLYFLLIYWSFFW